MEIKNIIRESIKKVLTEQTIEQRLKKEQTKGNKNYNGVSLAKIKYLETTYDPTFVVNQESPADSEVGLYIDWLVKHKDELGQYNQNLIRFGLQDLKDCKQILRNIGQSCEINSYSVQQIANLHVFMNQERNRIADEKNKRDAKAFDGQYEVAYESQNYFVVLAKTHAAERYFGQGTSWCTVGSLHYFDHYSDTGYFIVLPKKDGQYMWIVDAPEKYQFHISDALHFYCCDKHDSNVRLEDFPSELLDFVHQCIAEKKERVIGKCSALYLALTQIVEEQIHTTPIVNPKSGNAVYMLDETNNIRLVVNKANAAVQLKIGKQTKTIASGIGFQSNSLDTYITVDNESIEKAKREMQKKAEIITNLLKIFAALSKDYTFTEAYNRYKDSIYLYFTENATGQKVICKIEYGSCFSGSHDGVFIGLAPKDDKNDKWNTDYIEASKLPIDHIVPALKDSENYFLRKNEYSSVVSKRYGTKHNSYSHRLNVLDRRVEVDYIDNFSYYNRYEQPKCIIGSIFYFGEEMEYHIRFCSRFTFCSSEDTDKFIDILRRVGMSLQSDSSMVSLINDYLNKQKESDRLRQLWIASKDYSLNDTSTWAQYNQANHIAEAAKNKIKYIIETTIESVGYKLGLRDIEFAEDEYRFY